MGTFERPVLVVDDSEVIRTVLSDMLERFGISEVVCARDAKEAIELYEEHDPALVFLDITMPEVPGTRVANHILKTDPLCKVVLVTAVSRDVDLVESVISAGVYDYLRKPVRQEDLAAVLKRIASEDESPVFHVERGPDAGGPRPADDAPSEGAPWGTGKG